MLNAVGRAASTLFRVAPKAPSTVSKALPALQNLSKLIQVVVLRFLCDLLSAIFELIWGTLCWDFTCDFSYFSNMFRRYIVSVNIVLVWVVV